MKSLSLLSRNQHSDLFRKPKTGINMVVRKQHRRIVRLNHFSKDYTNQQNPNSWFNSKKFKALALQYQTLRNIHPGTTPISAELKKQITQKFTQDSHWLYFNYRNAMKQQTEYRQFLSSNNVDQQIASLPAKLRQQIGAFKNQKIPQMVNPMFHYSQQFQISLPTEQKHRRNLLLKIKNPPKDKSIEEEDQ